jgi:maltose O-acetyltransferase
VPPLSIRRALGNYVIHSKMKTEKEKMMAGEMYDPMDQQLVEERMQARLLTKALNETREDHTTGRSLIIKKLMPHASADLLLQPPFYCDYGYNIKVGERAFFNFNCIVLDVAPVIIGSRTLVGPNVQIYTATHPLNPTERSSGLEYAKPIVIGEDVWVGGSTVIYPGVTIGNCTTIGAGSVVTKDIPSNVFAAGNPCKVIRILEQTN